MTKEKTMKVVNINGTSAKPCKCGSWLDHWKNASGRSLAKYCPEANCIETPEVGAHVQKDSSTDRNWYIVPLCRTHNAETGHSLVISDSTRLVSVDANESCGK
jgi:hypothetical protein